MRRIIAIISFIAVTWAAWAVPATKEPIVRVQEDGTRDTVYLFGDEYCSYMGKEAFIPEEYISQRAKAPQRQTLYSYMPSKGTVKVPVLLANFSDLSFTITDPVAQFDDLFNGEGGSNPNATGSVHTYFAESSHQALDIEYIVYGPYTLSKTMEYYGGNSTNSQGVATNHNVHARELVTELVGLAHNAGVDFSQFDANSDGYIDNVSIVVAGYNEAEGGPAKSIWPHYSTINNSAKYNGKYISGYLMISEYRGGGGKTQAGIGTYCHEFGHALGLPDLYDTQNSSNYTVGDWSVMCSGCYNNNGSTPPTYTAFERFMMDWMTPTQITTSGLRTLEPIETSNEAFLIAASTHNMNRYYPNPSEYFLLENRQEVGWDAGRNALVATGLLISHITYNNGSWNYNTFNNSHPLGFDIVSASMTQPSKSSAADIFPGSTMRTFWMPTLNNGNTLPQYYVSQIHQRSDLLMSMRIGETGNEAMSFGSEEVDVQTPYLNQIISYDTAQVTLQINHLTQDQIRLYVSTDLFRISADNGQTWHKNKDTLHLSVTPDTKYTLPLLVLHEPKRKNCNHVYGILTAETLDETEVAQVTLAGRAPRPIYIETPVIDSVRNISTNSFTLYWEPQDDAELFYYALYTMSDGTSEEWETFEDFSTVEQIREQGWDANFANLQSTIAQTGKAILYNQTGQWLQTVRYIYPPSSLTFWLSNNLAPEGAGGETAGLLTITGSGDGDEWEEVAKVYVQRTTKNIERTIDLDSTKQWHLFRITYTHLGGTGGVAIDNWSAYFNKRIEYIHPLKKYVVYAPGYTIVFRDLQPGTTYYYVMQSFEEKGCEPHYSALSEPYAVRTHSEQDNPRLIVTRDKDGHYTVLLPEMADGKQYLYIYNCFGQVAYTLRPAYGTTEVALPNLAHGQIYLLKYFSGRMKRSDLSTKIMYY